MLPVAVGFPVEVAGAVAAAGVRVRTPGAGPSSVASAGTLGAEGALVALFVSVDFGASEVELTGEFVVGVVNVVVAIAVTGGSSGSLPTLVVGDT